MPMVEWLVSRPVSFHIMHVSYVTCEYLQGSTVILGGMRLWRAYLRGVGSLN